MIKQFLNKFIHLLTFLYILSISACNAGNSTNTTSTTETINWNPSTLYIAPSASLTSTLTISGESNVNTTVVVQVPNDVTGITISSNQQTTPESSTSCTYTASGSCTITVSVESTVSPLTMADLTVTSSDGVTVPDLTIYVVRAVHAYITNFQNNTVSDCKLNNNSSVESCAVFTANDSSDLSTLNGPGGIAFAVVNGLNYVYVVNSLSDSVSQCPIATTGLFGACSILSSPTFESIVSLEIWSVNGRNYAYIGSESGTTISICPITESGIFASCTSSDGNGTFAAPDSVAIGVIGSQEYAYIADQRLPGESTIPGTISVCTVTESGTFGTCSIDTPSTFTESTNEPGSIILANVNQQLTAFITDISTNLVHVCPIKNDATFDTCKTNSDASFNNPWGISFAIFDGTIYQYIAEAGLVSGNPAGTELSICPVTTRGDYGTCQTSTGFGTLSGIFFLKVY